MPAGTWKLDQLKRLRDGDRKLGMEVAKKSWLLFKRIYDEHIAMLTEDPHDIAQYCRVLLQVIEHYIVVLNRMGYVGIVDEGTNALDVPSYYGSRILPGRLVENIRNKKFGVHEAELVSAKLNEILYPLNYDAVACNTRYCIPIYTTLLEWKKTLEGILQKT